MVGVSQCRLCSGPLTEIEQRLAARIAALFLEEYQRTWADVADLRFTVDRVESDPKTVQYLPEKEPVLTVRFDVGLNDSHGAMSLCIPGESARRLEQMLSDNSSGNHSPGTKLRHGRNHETREGSVQLIAQLADTKINTTDLVGLRVGDIINTDQSVNAPILVSVDGVSKYQARLGALNGRKAIRIDEPESSPAPRHEKHVADDQADAKSR